MAIKVSVVVPVYNPGAYIEPCVRSILEQSLPDDDYEAIFVDDGSTDETPARLDRLAAEHANISVVHQENSGWPGKPRNVGIEAARGEYVFFLDQDDYLGREALQRMYAMATRNGADVLLGKMAGHGRRVPRSLFFENRDHATLADTPLMDGLTPHKLFRRAFIEQHGLRFPEGKRRLEDHPFVIRSYFLASSISVLADYVCYYHIRRGDLANAGLRRLDPAGYYGNLREVLAIVEEHTEPGPFRDRLLHRFARAELLERLRGKGFLEQPDDYRDDLFRTIRGVIADHIPPTVDRLLAPTYRIEMALVRAGRRDLVEELAAANIAIRARAEVIGRPTLRAGTLHVSFRGRVLADGVPLGIEHRDGQWLIGAPASVAAAVPTEARALPGRPRGTVVVLVRRRGDSAELRIPATVDQRVVQSDGTGAIEYRVTAAIRTDTANLGRPLWPGSWSVIARFEQLGYGHEAKLDVGPIVVERSGAVKVPGALRGGPVEQAVRRVYGALPGPLKSLARRSYRQVRPRPRPART